MSPLGHASVEIPPPPPHHHPPPPPPEEAGADLVVTEKFADTPPMVNVACTSVLYEGEDATRTFTVSPLDIVPATVVYARLLMEYDHPTMLMLDGALVPVSVMRLESALAQSSTPVCGVNAKASGVVSVGSPRAK